jgi:GT2 family glycosyltransferase/tetratricopeptide (TPR) repeat protein
MTLPPLRGLWRRARPERPKALAEADRARDEGRFADAAAAYATVLERFPPHGDTADLKVQIGNMLKDCGRHAEAEAAYRAALALSPGKADTHLQLGRLLCLTGRRVEALAAWRRALEYDADLADATCELAAAGDGPAQLKVYQAQMRTGAADLLIAIRSRMEPVAAEVDRMRERLSDAAGWAGFPIEAWGDLRTLHDVPDVCGGEAIGVSSVLAADAEPLDRLRLQIAAWREQSHTNWRLTAFGTEAERRLIVERAAEVDPRIAWRDVETNSDAPVEEDRIAREVAGDLILFLAPSVVPHRHALAWLTAAAVRCGAVATAFDEETVGAAGRRTPYLRAVVDRDTLAEVNVWGETLAIEANALRAVSGPAAGMSVADARSRLLRDVAANGPVAHIPLPLFATPADGRAEPAVTPKRPTPAGPDAQVAVVIPSKENVRDLIVQVESLLALAKRPEILEILVLNNGAPMADSAALIRLAALAGVRVHDLPEPFNWSRFNNLGVSMTQAPLLVFANDDMRMISSGWDEVVRALLERDDIGAVGARLLYPDDTIQHAGVLFDWRGTTIHDGLHRPVTEAGPAMRWQVTRSAGAVTGAFIATRREDFLAAGGFDAANLAVAFSDIDFALRLRARGLRILWTPSITLYHHESKTRGLTHLDSARAARESAEQAAFRARWEDTIDFDPGLNPFWVQATLPHQLVNFPSPERLWRYIEASGRPNPWIIPPPRT